MRRHVLLGLLLGWLMLGSLWAPLSAPPTDDAPAGALVAAGGSGIAGRAVVPTNVTIADGPSGGGFILDAWQPSEPSQFNDVAWNPNGSMLAAVDVLNGRLTVWSAADGRVIAWIGHPGALTQLAWLDDEHVIVGHNNATWSTYRVVDEYANRPLSTVTRWQGGWANDLTASNDVFTWGLDVSSNGTLVAFCGRNMTGDTVLLVAEAGWFTGGSTSNARTATVAPGAADCRFNPQGSSLAVLHALPSADEVGVYNTTDLGLMVNFSVGPDLFSGGLDWSPDGTEIAVGWTSGVSDEGVVSRFRASDGDLNGFLALGGQQVSDIQWSGGLDRIVVTVFDPVTGGSEQPGMITVLRADQDGSLTNLSQAGWHHRDAVAVSIHTDTDSSMIASAGIHGAVETWELLEDGSGLSAGMRFGVEWLRQIHMTPRSTNVVSAEGGGVATIRDVFGGSVQGQCLHPHYGEPVLGTPLTRSVRMTDDSVILGFDDGVVMACSLSGEQMWMIDLVAGGENVSAFGRAEPHPNGGLVAITWAEETNGSGTEGRLGVFWTDNGTRAVRYEQADALWSVDWAPDGQTLAAGGQLGGVYFWDTPSMDAAAWSEIGPRYTHADYVSSVRWYQEGETLLAVSTGWDDTAIVYDYRNDTPVSTIQLGSDGFDGFVIDGGARVLVASGDGSGSTAGVVQVRDIASGAVEREIHFVHVPRGIALGVEGVVIMIANHTGGMHSLFPDRDGDGIRDFFDMWPDDPTQWLDHDGDGHGDNYSFSLDGAGLRISENGDAFPLDFTQWHDRDGDGEGDNYFFENGSDGLRENELGDAFPVDPNQTRDRDGDGCGDNYSWTTVPDNFLRVAEQGDAFPSDASQCRDRDGDGRGDAADWDLAANGWERLSQTGDTFPEDVLQWNDTDSDGCGDAYSFDLDDTTGLRSQLYGDALPMDPRFCSDRDGDGVGDDAYTWEEGEPSWRRLNQTGDAFATDPAQWSDEDGDGNGDNYSFSLDGDGLRISENGDAFPLDFTQWHDRDGDGEGDNYTFDIDPTNGLRINEHGDAFPNDVLAWHDPDGDGCVNESATGLPIDLFPTDAAQCDLAEPQALPANLTVNIELRGAAWFIWVNWTGPAAHVTHVAIHAGQVGPGELCGAGCDPAGTPLETSNTPFLPTNLRTVLAWDGSDTLVVRVVGRNDTGDFVDNVTRHSISGTDPTEPDLPVEGRFPVAAAVGIGVGILLAIGAGVFLVLSGGGSGDRVESYTDLPPGGDLEHNDDGTWYADKDGGRRKQLDDGAFEKES